MLNKITLLLCLVCFFISRDSFAQSYIISTFAGDSIGGYCCDGHKANSAELNTPSDVCADAKGNIFIADTRNNRVREVLPNGIIYTIAGTGVSGSLGDGGMATDAELNSPDGAAVDDTGNIYIADYLNNRIRKVDTDGIISTVAGGGVFGFLGDGGPATLAGLNDPGDVRVDDSGNIYIADSDNNRIRKVNNKGIITTIAGDGTSGFSGDGGPATNASLAQPGDVAIDDSGNVFISDCVNNRIRKVNKLGIITTVIGDSMSGFAGDGGPATQAELNFAGGVTFDSSGNLYLCDVLNERIRKVDIKGIISTIAGNGTSGFYGDGGNALSAEMNYPGALAIDNSGSIYIADANNSRIRKLVIGTGFNQSSVNSEQLSVYLNPSSDYIHTDIKLQQPSNLQLHLVNMLGQTVWSIDAGNVSAYQNNISVANLPDGVYLLEMVTGGGTETKEVVVQK